ncbi:flagellar hook-basal body complex protein FliE [Paenibacillus apis]|uniref:Flagellar hook-basal body complex protein FliE n=1 Tax=Paenibacillus apis TaxID=1792174 RepID=A0A919Y448_9BACL|nr:flagellar hook-basal body complex protein FliE [Paenibacillus apis]
MIQGIDLNALNSVSPVGSTSGKTVSQTPAESMRNFGAYLSDALDSVAAQEKNVQVMNNKFLLGQVSADEVMIASEQAMLSLQLTTQVRNKVIEAYQEIMRTQI